MVVEHFCTLCCGSCSFTDRLVYTSYPPKYRCTFDNNFYDGDHSCHLELAPVRHGRWILEESPYAEYEEGVDGESHPRYVCSLCKTEAPFGCDPDGFATFQERSDFCSGCGAKMDLEG